MVLFDYIVAAIPMLGILVFVHELGHFVVAKLCGVRVLKFSLGFGSPIGFGRHRLRQDGLELGVAFEFNPHSPRHLLDQRLGG